MAGAAIASWATFGHLNSKSFSQKKEAHLLASFFSGREHSYINPRSAKLSAAVPATTK